VCGACRLVQYNSESTYINCSLFGVPLQYLIMHFGFTVDLVAKDIIYHILLILIHLCPSGENPGLLARVKATFRKKLC
jgi:hypothetical protein